MQNVEALFSQQQESGHESAGTEEIELDNDVDEHALRPTTSETRSDDSEGW